MRMANPETFTAFGLTGNRATYQEIVDDARLATNAVRVQLTEFDSATLNVRQVAWSDGHVNAVQRTLARVQQTFPFFDSERVSLPADANRWNRAVYLEGTPILACLEELADGVIDPRITQLAKLVAGMRVGFAAPLKARGKVVGALTFLFSEMPEEGIRRTAEAFVRQASLTLENTFLRTEAERDRVALDRILNSLMEGVMGISPDGAAPVWNESALRILGLAEEDVRGRSALDLVEAIGRNLGGPECLPWLQGVLSGTTSLPQELDAVVLNSHREITVLAYGIPVTGGARPMLGLLFRDVTDERELERRRGSFFAIASHELRTPMTSIMGFSELLVHRAASPQTMREWASYVLRQGRRMTAILDQMLNASQIQSGQITVKQQAVSLPEAVATAVTSSAAHTSKHRFITRIPEKLPLAKADHYKVIEVLTNLLDNAVKYSPKGGTITVAARHDAEHGRLVVSVADEGLGISTEDQISLFTPFYRAPNPEADGIGGVGLGLYISSNLVRLMHGDIWLESLPGHGATFYFTLPVPALGEPLERLSDGSYPD